MATRKIEIINVAYMVFSLANLFYSFLKKKTWRIVDMKATAEAIGEQGGSWKRTQGGKAPEG